MAAKTSGAARGHGIATYRARRDFAATAEPPPAAPAPRPGGPIFVVQKHAARRLHWDVRLEHGGVLWSWAVPKGPSLDPGDKRLAVRVEDHPLDYADFEGRIPAGQYGAGTVEVWDRGTWQPVGDPEEGLRRGELKFTLAGRRLRGGFVLVRLKSRRGERADNWLLIKEHDAAERPGADATALEAAPLRQTRRAVRAERPPIAGAVRDGLPVAQAPQLATLVETPPAARGWLSEVKFDGYRLLAFVEAGKVRLLTRGGHDWTERLPNLAALFGPLNVQEALLNGELVALRADGVSSFSALQEALSAGRDRTLFYYAFDLLHLDGWDLRPCRLADRKAPLRRLSDWSGGLRYSDHLTGRTAEMRKQACALGLEGIVCKQAAAPYRAGRSAAWVKVKCRETEEFLVLGFTPPAGSRTGLGALHLGYFDRQGALHYAGGVGSGFSGHDLAMLRRRLEPLTALPPGGLLYAEDPPDRRITWVRPELVAQVQFLGWSGGGRLRHAVFLGLREDKPPAEVVREVPNPENERRIWQPAPAGRVVRAARPGERTVVRSAPSSPRPADQQEFAGVALSHPDKELWPGISKRALAEYWLSVATQALPGIARRPLALLRCPEGVAGEHFFQKHRHPGLPALIRAGEAGGAPYLAIDDVAGLVAATQVAAIELHTWGAAEADALHPDRLVFDLDPGEGVAFADVVAAAQDVRERLAAAGLSGFCRTTGGKGLHVVAPLVPRFAWPEARDWCHALAQAMAADHPDRYVAAVPKQQRQGRILVDWLRNGLGATAVASFSPRARPGAGVATPLAWREVTAALDPMRFTLHTVPQRLARQRRDPWEGFAAAARPLPGGNG